MGFRCEGQRVAKAFPSPYEDPFFPKARKELAPSDISRIWKRGRHQFGVMQATVGSIGLTVDDLLVRTGTVVGHDRATGIVCNVHHSGI